MKFIGILGRQPELSLAELEARLGPGKIRSAGRQAALVDEAIDINRFGGIIKFAELLDTANQHAWGKDFEGLATELIRSNYQGKGKVNIGLSVYGGRVSAGDVQKQVYAVKKLLKDAAGISIRTIPNRDSELNAAQVTYNRLLGDKGVEFLVVLDGKTAHIAKTVSVQDIDAYARRDRQKPVRDPIVGMLPPKLAQTLINLARCEPGDTVLDPFCGTGTLLMEAQMMDMNIYGSDLAPKMVDASKQNLEWLAHEVKPPKNVTLEVADARSHQWPGAFDAVATETYLGPPLRELPDKGTLERIIEKVDDLHREFFHNISAQMNKGQRLAVAVPAWQTKSGALIRLPMLDDLEKLGYNRSSFEHVSKELVYRRANQVVAREILVLIRK